MFAGPAPVLAQHAGPEGFPQGILRELFEQQVLAELFSRVHLDSVGQALETLRRIVADLWAASLVRSVSVTFDCTRNFF